MRWHPVILEKRKSYNGLLNISNKLSAIETFWSVLRLKAELYPETINVNKNVTDNISLNYRQITIGIYEVHLWTTSEKQVCKILPD